jgi:hypothetical protein
MEIVNSHLAFVAQKDCKMEGMKWMTKFSSRHTVEPDGVTRCGNPPFRSHVWAHVWHGTLRCFGGTVHNVDL